MYSCEQNHNTAVAAAAAAAPTMYDSSSCLQPCAAGQLAAHQQQRGQVDPAGSAAPRRASKKKHGARPPSRRSSTTVVATDVNNFRAMVQELTGFPPAAIFRPLPRRVHAAVAANPFAVAAGQGCSSADGRGQAGSVTASTNAAGGPIPDAPAMRSVMPQSSPPCAPPGLFDGLSDIGSPVFDSWADLAIE